MTKNITPQYAFQAGDLKAKFGENAPLQSHIVSAAQHNSFELMTRAYNDLFVKLFPLDQGGEPVEKWMNRISFKEADSRYIVNIVGEGLEKPSTAKLRGISVGIYYRDADVGLLAYNVVDENSRNMGIGKIMVEQRKAAMLAEAEAAGKKLRGVFLECNNPARISAAEDSIDPNKRIAMYQKWGARVVDIDYVCPDEAPGGGKVGTLILLAFPHPKTGKYPGKRDVEAYLRAFYQKHGIAKPDEDVDFQGMMEQLHNGRKGAMRPLAKRSANEDVMRLRA